MFNCNIFAQNLVPNPSFEELDSCPNSMSQIDYASGWKPFTSSPDLFHTCANFPGNISAFKYQCPATGNGFAGMFCYLSNSYEIIGIRLIDSLIIGTKYYIGFKVNLVNSAKCGIDKLGARFSTKKYCYSLNDTTNLCDSTPAPINNFAHIYSTQIITDTINWTKISGSFVADSNYKYIMIGHLFDNSATNFYPFPPDVSCSSPYYLIDNICVSTDSLTCVDIINDIIDFNSDSTIIKEGSCINFSVNTVVDYDFYEWQFPGAMPNSSIDSMPTNICYDSSGNFDVILIVSSSSGCSDTIYKENYITVKEESSVGEIYEHTLINIYPNPAKDRVSIIFDGKNKKTNVKIYNLLGVLVAEYSIHQPVYNIELQNFNSGMYIIEINTSNNLIVKKLIIYQN